MWHTYATDDCNVAPSFTNVVPEQSYVVNTETGAIFVCGLAEIL